MDLLEGLNAAQREAVTTTEGFVRVIAGRGLRQDAGADAHRFAYLVNGARHSAGEHLLCVTFTNKAANEMRQRIHNLTGDNDTGYINTFHGFCVSILQEDSHAVRLSQELSGARQQRHRRHAPDHLRGAWADAARHDLLRMRAT